MLNKPAILFAIGVVLIGVHFIVPLSFGPSAYDALAAGQPRLSLPLAGLPAGQAVTITLEVPNSEQWARIRQSWGDPGYVVYAETGQRWLIPFKSLHLSVEVRRDGEDVAVGAASHAPYGISSDSLDYGVAFSGNAGDRLQVTLTSGTAVTSDGVLVIEPYWGFRMKDHIVGTDVEESLRGFLIWAAGAGFAIVIAAGVLLVRQSA